MSRRNLIIAVVVVVFLAVGGFLIYRQISPGGQTRSIDAAVTGNQMTPSSIEVHQGDRVTLSVTADKKEEIHLHGYDIHFEIEKPGDKVTKTFTADKTGDFEIEIEASSSTVGHLKVSP